MEKNKQQQKKQPNRKKPFIDLFKITKYSPKHWFSVNRNANLPKTLQRGIKSKWVDRFISDMTGLSFTYLEHCWIWYGRFTSSLAVLQSRLILRHKASPAL